MTIINVPDDLAYDSAELDYLANIISNTGRTGTTQRVVNPGSFWGLKFTLPIMKEEEARLWRSFMMALSGANEFLYGPPGYNGASVYSGPDPVVKGAGQSGVSLLCDGVTANTTILKDGEFLASANELKVQIGDAVSDALGEVTFNFEPMLRASPADNAVIEIQNPKVKFMLVDGKVGFSYSVPSIQEVKAIIAVEVID